MRLCSLWDIFLTHIRSKQSNYLSANFHKAKPISFLVVRVNCATNVVTSKPMIFIFSTTITTYCLNREALISFSISTNHSLNGYSLTNCIKWLNLQISVLRDTFLRRSSIWGALIARQPISWQHRLLTGVVVLWVNTQDLVHHYRQYVELQALHETIVS